MPAASGTRARGSAMTGPASVDRARIPAIKNATLAAIHAMTGTNPDYFAGSAVVPPTSAYDSLIFTTFDPAKVTNVILPGGMP